MSHSSASLIDHVYTNILTDKFISGIIINDVADHFGIFYCVRKKNKIHHSNTIQRRNVNAENTLKFRSKLEECDFTSVLATSDPNEAYDEFMKLYCGAFEVIFPLRGVTKKRQYIKREPWVTPALLVSSRKKAKLYAKKMRNPTDHNKTLFREYNNIFVVKIIINQFWKKINITLKKHGIYLNKRLENKMISQSLPKNFSYKIS